jgi:hypothetical protein
VVGFGCCYFLHGSVSRPPLHVGTFSWFLTPNCMSDHICSIQNFGSFVCGQLNSFDCVNFFYGQYRRVTFELRHF